ncbi:MAG: DUF2934 domain-containing protein [Nitrospiria bacterium]
MDLHEKIAQLAYELYEKNGKIEGRELDHWLEAEKMIKESVRLNAETKNATKGERRRGHRRKI